MGVSYTDPLTLALSRLRAEPFSGQAHQERGNSFGCLRSDP